MVVSSCNVRCTSAEKEVGEVGFTRKGEMFLSVIRFFVVRLISQNQRPR